MEISSISVDGLRKVNLVFTLAKIILNRYFLLLNVKKMALKLNITFKNIQTKQNSKVTYLGFILDENFRWAIDSKSNNEINSRLYLLSKEKTQILTPVLDELLCNSLIQPHFNYASSTPNLN